MDISKVVIPAAGLGNRFLPYSKAIPREMLPLSLKPAFHYIAEEALASGLNNMIVITSRQKQLLEDYFDVNAIDPFLKTTDKAGFLASIEKIAKSAHFTYVRQQEPLGIGHALWLARHSIHKEYFGVSLPDDIIISKQPALSQLMRVARQEKASVIAVQEVPSDQLSQYGVVGIRKTITPNLFQLSHVVEKPQPKDAPSSLAIVGRYILSSKIFNSLEQMIAYDQQDLLLTDALSHMMQNNERVFAYKIQGTRFDIGSHIGWLKAVIGLGLIDPDTGPIVRKLLQDLQAQDLFMYNAAKSIEHTI